MGNAIFCYFMLIFGVLKHLASIKKTCMLGKWNNVSFFSLWIQLWYLIYWNKNSVGKIVLFGNKHFRLQITAFKMPFCKTQFEAHDGSLKKENIFVSTMICHYALVEFYFVFPTNEVRFESKTMNWNLVLFKNWIF